MSSRIEIAGASCVVGDQKDPFTIRSCTQKVRSQSSIIDPEHLRFDLSGIDTGPFPLFREEKILTFVLKTALERARVRVTSRNAHRCSILVGNTYGAEGFKVKNFKAFHSKETAKTFLVPYSATNALAIKMSTLFRFKGPTVTFSSGATSTGEAIVAGADLIESGRADVVVIVGLNFLCDDLRDAFRRVGFRQESCAAVVLKRKCEKTKETSYGIISDIRHGFYSGPRPRTLSELIKKIFSADYLRQFDKMVISEQASFLGDPGGGRMALGKFGDRIIPVSDLVGNVLCSSGTLGTILSGTLLKGRDLKAQTRKILFVNWDRCGSYVSMAIRSSREPLSVAQNSLR